MAPMSQPVAAVLGMLAALVMLAIPAAFAAPRNGPGHGSKHGGVPLPKPRPEAASNAEAEPAGAAAETAASAPAPATPEPSACRQTLTEDIAIAPSLPPIKGPGGCGGDDLVRLEAVVLLDKTRVALKPAATLRCTMAAAVADWVRTDLVALAASHNTTLRAVDNFDSFECRGRNRVVGAMLSEHGKANALDVRSVSFADGRELKLTDRSADRSLRETVLHSVCGRFSTVLGPSSDWYHEDHIHLDLAVRRGNYRICEWDVLDPMPAVAPMLPAVRPDDAPPREAGDKTEQPAAKSDAPAADAADQAAPPPRESTSPARASKSKGRLKQAPLSAELKKLL